MSDSVRERLARIQRLLRGEEDAPLAVESSGNDVVLVNLEGDCGLFASAQGTVELQTRRAGLAVSDDVVSVVARYVVIDSEGGLHLMTPKDRVFLMDRLLDRETVDGKRYVTPKSPSSLSRRFLDETQRPVSFDEIFETHQVFVDLPRDTPQRRLVDQLNRLTGGMR